MITQYVHPDDGRVESREHKAKSRTDADADASAAAAHGEPAAPTLAVGLDTDKGVAAGDEAVVAAVEEVEDNVPGRSDGEIHIQDYK